MTILPWQSDVVEFREKGSYRFTDQQRSAYALYFDIQIISFVHFAYESLKTTPSESFWGNATIFQGTSITEKKTVRFPKQRVFSTIERETYLIAQGRDQYNELQLTLASGFSALGVAFIPGEAGIGEVVAIPETVIKFVALPLSQFRFSVYWLDFREALANELLFQAEDPTDGDDEFPEPNRNPENNPYDGNVPPSVPNSESDPRDFAPSEFGPVVGFGLLRYNFRDQASGPFQPTTIASIGYPGFMSAGTSGGFDAIFWNDASGFQTLMVLGGSPPVQVNEVRITVGDVIVYTPFVTAFNAG